MGNAKLQISLCADKVWMYECCTDENGNKYGWAKVLDYIGVKY